MSQDIKEKGRNLCGLEKIHLIEMLMDELDILDPDVEKLWIEESEQRYKAYKAGKVKWIPLEHKRKVFRMNVIFIPPANDELDDAITYYSEQLAGLDDQFYNTFFKDN